MHRGQPVDLEIGEEPLFDVQFVKRKRGAAQASFHPQCAEIVVQVDYVIKLISFQILNDSIQIIFHQMKVVDVWIVLQDGPECIFGEKMNFRIGHLIFQATDYRRCQNDIADGRKPDDEKLWQNASRLS
jgi:hypothetical protein